MYIVVLVVLFAVFTNILVTNVIEKTKFEKKIIDYMKKHNYSSPYCYTKYLATVSRSLTGLKIDMAIDDNKNFVDCSANGTLKYKRCDPFDFATQTHPCNYVRSKLTWIINS